MVLETPAGDNHSSHPRPPTYHRRVGRDSQVVVPEEQWRARTAAHEARVDAATAAHRARRRDGRAHPVEDFLFTYYSFAPAKLRRWHPGAGLTLESGHRAPQRNWRFYRMTDGMLAFDADAFVAAGAETLRFVRDLHEQTRLRPGRFSCFGLHEWAMVYRLDPSDLRHADWPLRLGSEGTDEVVDTHHLVCSHVDAVRFFTPQATPRNALAPTRASQAASEQPGCLHAGMDLYKWAHKLAPATPSELVMDCLELAREIRSLDMRAAPYDLTGLGYQPLLIETPEGKAQYAAEQRLFAARGQVLRTRLVEAIDQVWSAAGVSGETSSSEPLT